MKKNDCHILQNNTVRKLLSLEGNVMHYMIVSITRIF